MHMGGIMSGMSRTCIVSHMHALVRVQWAAIIKCVWVFGKSPTYLLYVPLYTGTARGYVEKDRNGATHR